MGKWLLDRVDACVGTIGWTRMWASGLLLLCEIVDLLKTFGQAGRRHYWMGVGTSLLNAG